MTRFLEQDTLSNQDISNALAIGAYTADADRLVLVQFFADQVAGNGDYVFYVTQQVAGAGSHYRLIPITTAAAASGVTAIAAQSGMIAVRSGDVLTVYLDGLAGDNSTPDTTVRWFELAALRPTTADRTLAVDANGYVVASNALDAAGTRSALGMAAANLDTQIDALPTAAEAASATRSELATELARIDVATSTRLATAGYTAPPSAATVASQVDVTLSAAHGSGPWGGSGAGTGTYSDTVTDGVDPLDNVLVQLSTDEAGANIAYSTHTAADGSFTMRPDPGTYYVWLELAGYEFTQGAEVTVA